VLTRATSEAIKARMYPTSTAPQPRGFAGPPAHAGPASKAGRPTGLSLARSHRRRYSHADPSAAQGPKVRRLFAGGSRIRTNGPAEKETAVREAPRPTIVVSRDDLCLMTPSNLSVRRPPSATAERPFARAGPMVRNRFPPAESQVRTALTWLEIGQKN